MTEFKVGDKIHAKNYDTEIIATLCESAGDVYLGASGWALSTILADFWEVTLVESAPEPLPTEEGWYVAFDRLANEPFVVEIRSGNSRFWYRGNPLGNPERFAPFTRLEPVPDTASRVINRLVEQAEMHGEELWGVQQIKNDFGVTP